MDNRGIIPIMEKFLQNNYLLVLEFRQGFIFGRVIRRRVCRYKPYPLIDSNGNPVDIPPNGYQTELSLVDPRNRDKRILFLSTVTDSGYPWILHGSIGIKPEYIYMYPRFPSGQEIPGKFPELDPVRPSQGDNFAYVNSEVSPYDTPTDYVEYIIPPTVDIGFEFYNKDTERSHQPVLNILFSVYWFQALDPGRYGRLISRIATRDVPAAWFTVGFGNMPLEYSDVLAKGWKVDPITLDEAIALGGR